LLADSWHTCFFDLDGRQGLLGQVQGRTADDAAYWLADATPAWRDAVQVVCIDLCSIYASAVRRMLPRATLTMDLFHTVQLGGQGRRRRAPPGGPRPVRAPRPLRRPRLRHQGPARANLEHLTRAQLAKIIDTLDRDRYGQEIAAAWIGKESSATR
jgi:transposase